MYKTIVVAALAAAVSAQGSYSTPAAPAYSAEASSSAPPAYSGEPSSSAPAYYGSSSAAPYYSASSAPPAYSGSAPPAYSSEVSSAPYYYPSSSSSSAYPSSTAPAFAMPTCWESCFAKYQVDSEGCLCSDSLGDVVSSCIQSGCDAADSAEYAYWLGSYCNDGEVVSTTASNTWAVPTSVPVYSATTSLGGYTTLTPPAPTGTWASSGSVPPFPVPSGSSCVETSTLIYRSSTSYSVYTVSHGPSGYVTETGAWATGTAASATGTAAVPSYSGPSYATGAAAELKVGGLMALVAGVAGLLFM